MSSKVDVQVGLVGHRAFRLTGSNMLFVNKFEVVSLHPEGRVVALQNDIEDTFLSSLARAARDVLHLIAQNIVSVVEAG